MFKTNGWNYFDHEDNFFNVAYFWRNVFNTRNILGVPLEIEFFYDYICNMIIFYLMNSVASGLDHLTVLRPLCYVGNF